MNQVLVNTNFDFQKQCFDKYNEEFVPSDESFDFVELQALPQDFIDFVRESTKCLKNDNEFIKYINDDNNEQKNKQFHLKVIELLMLFGLSFSTNDFLDYNTLKTHRNIIEEDLLITIEDDNLNQKSQENDNETQNEGYFSELFEHTKEFLNKALKSVIFLFNFDGNIKTYCHGESYLNKAPIILVYSKTQGRILFPSSFRYYSRGLTIERSMKEKSKFYSICEYRLVEDHWIPHTQPEDIKQVSEAIFNLTKANEKQKISIRNDFLSFDFLSFLDLNLNVVGLIGQCDDVFKRMDFEIELTLSHEKNYPEGFYPKNKLHPELVLYLTDKIVDSGKQTHLAYLFLFIPYFNPQFPSPKSASPMSSTYEEATIDAYMRMKSCCSQVVLVARKEEEELSDKKIILKNFQHYINNFVFIFGRNIKPTKFHEGEKNFDSFFFGSNDTVNYCEIIDESFKESNEITKSKNEYEEIEFDSLQHFIKWLEWESRVFNISFEIENFKSKEILSKDSNLSFFYNNNKKFRFHQRTKNTRISCEISSEIFGVVRQHMIRNIRFFDENVGELKKSKAKIIINKIIAYEDGQLQVQIKYESLNGIKNINENKNTYKFYKIEQSPSKVAVPGYFNKIAVLRNIESEFVLLNSWYVDDSILLTLFYSKLEGKTLIIVIRRHFKDRTPPTPIYEIESDYNLQYNSMCRTSEYYSSFDSKTRLLLFTIVEDGHSKILSGTIKKDYTVFSNITKRNIDNFIPLEAKDKNFVQRKNEKLSNDENPLSCFPHLSEFKDHEVRFTGFAINENGNEAVMYFNCYISLKPVKEEDDEDKKYKKAKKSVKFKKEKVEKAKGRYHYLVYFNPVNLKILKTIKFDQDDFMRITGKDIENSIKNGSDAGEKTKNTYNFYKGAIQFSIAFPTLYVNNSLLFILYYDRLSYDEENPFQGITLFVINNIKNLETNTFNNIDDYLLTPNTLLFYLGPTNLFEAAKSIHHFGFIQTLNTFEFVKILQDKSTNNPIDRYKYNPSPIRLQHVKSDYTRNKKELEKKGLIKFPEEKSLFMNLLVDPDNIYSFQFPDFNKCLNQFDFESVSRLVIQTDEKYGMNIIGQLIIPEPNRIPLQLSLINVTSNDKDAILTKEDIQPLIDGLQNSENLHLFTIGESQKDNYRNCLHKSALRFIVSLFSSVQIVVSGPIVDSATMSFLTYNAKFLDKTMEVQEKQKRMKSAMQLCYTIRSRSFPSFPFLRMTSESPIFHIGVLGERDSGSSSLLSWLTGCAFTNMPNNTLAIGSNSFPTFNRSSNIFEQNWSIKKDSVNGIINVVGSLFTVEQGTFSQVVGFISALSACDTIILEFTELRNILIFFRMFFDSADLLCSEFDIKLPINENDNNKNSSSGRKQNRNVAIFCNTGSEPESYIQFVKNEVYSLIEERLLESSSSVAVQAIEKIDFKFMAQSSSAQEKAIRLRKVGFINVLDSTTKTSELMAPLRNMSLIFGQQIDHEANVLSKKDENQYIPYVIKDEESSRQEELYTIANQILKKSLGDSDSRREAERLLMESSNHGNIKANVKLRYNEDEVGNSDSKKKKKELESIFKFLDAAIEDGSEEAIEEKCQIVNKWYHKKIVKIKKLDAKTALKGLRKYHQRYSNGEIEQTSQQILNLINYIILIGDDKIRINNEILYTGIEIMINRGENKEKIQSLFELIPENQRTNHSINFRFLNLICNG